MTFAIAARCPETGMFGAAVSSSSPAVAARCVFVKAGVGAMLSQNITDPRLGPLGLALMADGRSARQAVDEIVETAPHIAYRQLAAVDREGGTASYSGANTLGAHAVAEGEGAVVAGNLLASEHVPEAMLADFTGRAAAPLGERLVAAMEAGLAAGGEAGPVHSAGLVMADKEDWPIADLRVDWSEGDPIAELRDLWALWAPQMHAYVTRCLDPASAPSYGVPGDE